jgi:hypothetical protein
MTQGQRFSVDDLIDAGASVADVFPYFKTRKAAALHYGDRRATTFPADGAAGPCYLCRGAADLRVTALEWQVPVTSLVLGFLVLPLSLILWLLRQELVLFRTHHVLCRPCFNAVRMKYPLRKALQLCGSGLLLLGAAVSFIGLHQLSYGNVRGHDEDYFRWVTIGGGACIVAGILCLAAFACIRIPSALRQIAPPPFDLRWAEPVG